MEGGAGGDGKGKEWDRVLEDTVLFRCRYRIWLK